MILLITLSTFVCITLLGMAVYWTMFRPASAATERLRRMNQPGGAGAAAAAVAVSNSPLVSDDDPLTKMAERVAAPLARLAPPSAAEAHRLQKQLMQAGYRSPNAPAVFRALQFVVLFGYPAFVLFVGVLIARPFEQLLIPVLVAFVKGFFLPRLMLNRAVKRRQQRVRWGLADALDLMVVSIEAGLGLNAALVRVGEELKNVHPEISVMQTNVESVIKRIMAL